MPNVADKVTREAYCDEVSSCGFWLGGPGMEKPIFYSYAYPPPSGFPDAAIRPAAAFFSRELGEFILPRAELGCILVAQFFNPTWFSGQYPCGDGRLA